VKVYKAERLRRARQASPDRNISTFASFPKTRLDMCG